MNMALFARKEASPANNYIFIFDEPATALHPHGQVNVQRVFETLSRKNQITYTTHSIFMVNKNFPPRNRAVTKTERGTVVDHKPYIGNWKAVRSNLGLILSNNFFVADTTLLVEGPSDEIYIASLLRACDRLGVIDVDLNLFSIHDAGSSADMVAMAKLMADEGRRVVAMVDGDAQGAATKKRIEQVNANQLKEGPKVEVIALLKNKSTEDYALYPELLRDAVVKTAEELVSANIRRLKEGLTVDGLRESLDKGLKDKGDVTLGKAIHDVTKIWFDGDEDPVSKLHVARVYDDLVEALGDDSPKPAKAELTAGRELAADIHKRLKLPEKMASETVVE
jgi:predicted ATP-dependent endonuclease of OLD family